MNNITKEIMALIDESAEKARDQVKKEIMDDIKKDFVLNPVSFRTEGLCDRIAQATKFCMVAYKLLLTGTASITFHPKLYGKQNNS